jgi:hypothetical protein
MRLVELPVWVKFTMSLAPMRRAVVAIELAIASLIGVLGGIEGLAGELLIGELFLHRRGDRGLHRDGFDRVKPEALSPESMTQSELSSIAVATSLTSARVGLGWESSNRASGWR